MRRAILLVVALSVAVAGCGADKPDITDNAGAQLQARVAEIRRLAAERQADQVAAKLAELRKVTEDLRAADQLSDDAARKVIAAAEAVQAQLALITTTTTTTPPPPREDKDRDEEDKEEGKGKGKDD